ncbi:metallophosphoesterase family protein [Leptospira neocaledonica]|uniref:metallophosphoesterase family protein n=1 Tax=Leptospira neocaledonica TaxID=2023192 RepID=UPI001AD84324|nr:metallophosphoesterase [Leptospira neocaledonica]
MEEGKLSRKDFLRRTGGLLAASIVPMSLVEIACGGRGKGTHEKFTFAFISDPHLTHIKGTNFVRNFDSGLNKAIETVNLMFPRPDFVVFGGDLAQLGKREELDHGMELLSKLKVPVKFVIGEHDYYLDMGNYWQDKISKLNYSFDHKGVHFVVLNSILTYDTWIKRWKTPEERMNEMARLDNPNGSPFMVGDDQIAWLKKDLENIKNGTPLVVLSHSPLYKIYKPWNFWTDDAEKIQSVLSRFDNVTVFHGHVHQVLYNQIKNISFYALMSTAWPWPYPESYTQSPHYIPKMTVFMNRQDPFHERDGTGWAFVNMDNAREEMHYKLWENKDRIVKYDDSAGHPVDSTYQKPESRILPQTHY